MSLYKNWTDMVVDYVKTRGEAAFWKEYGAIETKIYAKLLADRNKHLEGNFQDLAKQFEIDDIFFMGFLDGINDSLTEQLDLENINQEDYIKIDVDFEKLYFNMLEAKADYLYELSQWEGIFSKEKRKEIHSDWKNSKTVVNKNKIGRNEPCPCGSGKKYKQCCGKN